MRIQKTLCAVLAASIVFMSAMNSPAFVSGDIDDDGIVRLADALLLLRYFAGTESLTSFQLYVCDVTGGGGPLPSPDGKCFITDYIIIHNKSRGLISF